MKKRFFFASIILFFLFILPTQVHALSCVEPNIKYYLACENEFCEGFKVHEEFEGGACQRLPYVVDLKTDEGYQIHDHLFNVTEQIEENGFWVISMNLDCAFALRREQTTEYVQDQLERDCGENGERINIEKLAESRDAELLQTLREVEDKDARSVRVTFYISQVIRSAITLLIGALLPLLIILRYLKFRQKSFFKYVVLALVAQMGIYVFLAFFFAYLDWATISLVIITALFLAEIGLLIGAKIENHYHKRRKGA